MSKDGNIWMNQNQLAELFDTSKQNVGQHIKSILEDSEFHEDSVVKKYFTTASDGKDYEVTFYALDMILAIGFRVRSKRGTQFRIRANKNLKEYMIKGFVILYLYTPTRNYTSIKVESNIELGVAVEIGRNDNHCVITFARCIYSKC